MQLSKGYNKTTQDNYHTDCIIRICMYYRMLEFRWENWMVVGVLTPCLIALYLMIMMVAYHMFCKKQHPEANAVHNNIQPTQYLEVLYHSLEI